MPLTRRLLTPKKWITVHEFVTTDQVLASGGVADDEFTIPDGEIWRLLNVYVDIPIPAGGGSGDHEVVFKYKNAHANNYSIRVSSAFGTAIRIQYGSKTTGTTENPDDAYGQFALNMRAQIYDSTNPLVIHYYNGTDANQVGTRTYHLVWLKEKVV